MLAMLRPPSLNDDYSLLVESNRLMHTNELIVDNFAGGGGASTGIELALRRPVDIAINHDAQALALHAANHPQTRHLQEDVFAVDPVAVTALEDRAGPDVRQRRVPPDRPRARHREHGNP